jgi:hypothetical protein
MDEDQNYQDDIATVIAIIRRIADDAYSRGKSDALQRMVVAAQGELAGQGQFAAHVDVQHPPTNGATPPPRRPGGQPGMKRASRGSVTKYVNQVLSDPDYQGATWEGVFELVRALGGSDIAPASVRNYLRSAEIRGETRRQNGNWFLRQPPWARDGGEDRALTRPDISSEPQQ